VWLREEGKARENANSHPEDTKDSELCEELGVARAKLYRYLSLDGELHAHEKRALTGF